MTKPPRKYGVQPAEKMIGAMANGHDRAAFDLPAGYALHWLDKEVPPMGILVSDLIPDHMVSICAGDGGSGKSILMQTLATCVASLDKPFLGRATEHGRAVFITGEDPEYILHIRQVRICQALGLTLHDVGETLIVKSMADHDVFLFSEGKPTALAEKLEQEIEALGVIRLLVLDSATFVFDDNEIDRRAVSAFLRHLNRMAKRLRCAIVLVTHTSRTSDASPARMTSGSTGWAWHARSGLLLKATEDGATLTALKTKHTKQGLKIDVVWTDDGVLVMPEAKDWLDSKGQERKLLELVEQRWAEGNPLAAVAQARGRYLPSVVATLGLMRAGDAEKLMLQLMHSGAVFEDQKTTKTPRGLRLKK